MGWCARQIGIKEPNQKKGKKKETSKSKKSAAGAGLESRHRRLAKDVVSGGYDSESKGWGLVKMTALLEKTRV